MTKIFVYSDCGISSGFGRISATLNIALHKRGYEIIAASMAYDGKLPAMYDGERLPYHVAALQPYARMAGGFPSNECMELINATQPDIVVVIQDAPYAVAMRALPLDWSRHAFIVITPVDGAPIFPDWVECVKNADAALTISEFGVKTFAEQGASVGLCRPGIDPDRFYRLPDDKRAELRTQLGIAPDAYVHGVFCQLQGRKAIPHSMKAFFDFAKDKPTARLVLDMDETSPAGWHLPALIKQFGWDESKVIFRSQALQAGIVDLNHRYNLLDSHSVISFREGWGLPLVEAMATGAVSMALDWCSGTEIVGDGKGILIPSIQLDGEDYFNPSTWGNALDKMPDYKYMARKMQWLFDNPDERRAMGKRGMTWAREQHWSKAVDNVDAALQKALAKKKIAPIEIPKAASIQPVQNVLALQPDGVKPVELVENML